MDSLSADEQITPEKIEKIADVAFNTLFDLFRNQCIRDMKEKSDCMAFPDLNGVRITKEMLERATKYIKPE